MIKFPNLVCSGALLLFAAPVLPLVLAWPLQAGQYLAEDTQQAIPTTTQAVEKPLDEKPEHEKTANEESVEIALNYIRNNQIERGVFILQRLAGQGNGDSLYHMGELYRLGIGREKSASVATMYYRLATALDHEKAALALANFLYFEGDGSEKTIAEALGVWQNLALNGNVESMYLLGMVYWNGDVGLEQDPIRGYGLVWRASQAGYRDAEQSELTMHSILNAEAREAAMEYGKTYTVKGFTDKIAAPDVLTVEAASTEIADASIAADSDVAPTAEPTKTAAKPAPKPKPKPLVRPDDWTTVWRLEVGLAMSKLEVRRLQSLITQAQAGAVGGMFSEILPSTNRPGLYRLIYGPVSGLHQAVSTCVTLKRSGHDCAAKAPESD
jgi:cell division septation protein DedD